MADELIPARARWLISSNEDEAEATLRWKQKAPTFRVETDIVALEELCSQDVVFSEARHHIGGVGEGDSIQANHDGR